MEAKHEWLLLWRNHEKSTYCELISAECWRILQVCSEETARTKAEPEDQDYYGNMALSEAASPTFHIFTKFFRVCRAKRATDIPNDHLLGHFY